MARKVAIIASLYPARMTAKRPGFTPQPFYDIAAAEDLQTPAVCVVQQQTEYPYMGYGRAPAMKWEAEDVASDLVTEWSSGLPGSGAEGGLSAIWVSEGARPGGNGDWLIPEEEIKFYRLRQDAVLKNLVHQARWFHGQKQDNAILSVMHKAAEWLNISGEPWQQELTSGARFKCGFCKSTLDAGTIVCPNCKEILDRAAYDKKKGETLAVEMAYEGEKVPAEGGDPVARGERDRLANELGLPPDEVVPRAKATQLATA